MEDPRTLIRRTLRPFQAFLETESASGVVLLAAAVFALAWANSPWATSYFRLWETRISFAAADFRLARSLHDWINDGLMVVFFFLVGLEIKRELLVGELASPRRAAMPMAAALGGMIVPAALYLALNAGTPTARGWGIPMATDIAFALGALALLGKRIPLALKVFLAALAIVDDLGAVLVIALFYTSDLSWVSLGIAALTFLALIGINRLDVRHPGAYGAIGVVLWLAFLESGVHATIAGVLLALTIPARTRIDGAAFVAESRASLDEFEAAGGAMHGVLPNEAQQAALHRIEESAEAVQAPLQRLERGLQGWVAFGIMPLFALANAGVALGGDPAAFLHTPVTLGVMLGLVVGKPVGVLLFSWLAIHLGVATTPAGVEPRHFIGVSLLAGIGFTMSLFIANLAFGGTALLGAAKVGILAASAIAGAAGLLVLARAGGRGAGA
ncbi:MAG TPA: Na+/H+ antiporter NhaA [Longimicrobiales bacterium]